MVVCFELRRVTQVLFCQEGVLQARCNEEVPFLPAGPVSSRSRVFAVQPFLLLARERKTIPVKPAAVCVNHPEQQVVSKVSGGDWEFVPDGLQVWRHYLEWEEEAAKTPSR